MQLLLKIKNIIVLIVISISLSACMKDYDLNPYTTVLNQLIKSYEVEQKVCVPDVNTSVDLNGKRHYDVGTEEKLPSVTTILSATQSEEKKQKLEEWKKRMGEQRADRIRDISAMRGTSMHTYLEGYIKDERHLDLTALGQEAGRMADVVIRSGLGDLEEVWGTEVTLYYPGLYAGATDVVGIYNGLVNLLSLTSSRLTNQNNESGLMIISHS